MNAEMGVQGHHAPGGDSKGAEPLWPPAAGLWERASALRREIWGRKVFLRGIIELSSHCRQNCLYCGLRRDNKVLARYRLLPEEIMACARQIKDLGFGTVVLQSGEDPDYPALTLASVITRIKAESGLAVTLSFGERERADYAVWREAGADRYLLKMETMDEDLYARLRPGRRLEERFAALEVLRALGYETGSGLIAGLPGEKAEDFERGLASLAAWGPDMFSVSPFLPHPQTPLGQSPACGPEAALRAMALARVACPRANIPVTSALGLAGEKTRLTALEVGNVLMPSLTPEKARRAYAIYPGKNAAAQEPVVRAREMKESLLRAGFETPADAGGAFSASGPDLQKKTEATP